MPVKLNFCSQQSKRSPYIQETDPFVCSGYVKLPARSYCLQVFIMVGEPQVTCRHWLDSLRPYWKSHHVEVVELTGVSVELSAPFRSDFDPDGSCEFIRKAGNSYNTCTIRCPY